MRAVLLSRCHNWVSQHCELKVDGCSLADDCCVGLATLGLSCYAIKCYVLSCNEQPLRHIPRVFTAYLAAHCWLSINSMTQHQPTASSSTHSLTYRAPVNSIPLSQISSPLRSPINYHNSNHKITVLDCRPMLCKASSKPYQRCLAAGAICWPHQAHLECGCC